MKQSDSLVDRGMIVRAICEIRERKRRWFKENGGEGSGVRKQFFFSLWVSSSWTSQWVIIFQLSISRFVHLQSQIIIQKFKNYRSSGEVQQVVFAFSLVQK